MIQIPAQQSFLQQVEGIVILVLGGLAIPFVMWVKAKLGVIHDVQQNNTAVLATVNQKADTMNQKADTITAQTNGVNQTLQDHIQAQAVIIDTQAKTIAKQA